MKANKYVEDVNGVKHDRTHDKWKKIYNRMQEQTKPSWDEYLVVQDAFMRDWKPSDGDFLECWAIKCFAAFEECMADKEKYLEEYWVKCKELGVVE